jgi:hypothetical protein
MKELIAKVIGHQANTPPITAIYAGNIVSFTSTIPIHGTIIGGGGEATGAIDDGPRGRSYDFACLFPFTGTTSSLLFFGSMAAVPVATFLPV